MTVLFFLLGCASTDSNDNDGETNSDDISPSGTDDTETDTVIDTERKVDFTDDGPVCGNNIREYGEECDDGNEDNGDGCQSDCKEEVCGNDRLEEIEECDDGNTENKKPTGGLDGCDENCLLQECGNERLEGGEECEEGVNTEEDERTCIDCKWKVEDGICGDCPQTECATLDMISGLGDDLGLKDIDTDTSDAMGTYELYSLCYGSENADGAERGETACGRLMQCIAISGCLSEIADNAAENEVAVILEEKCYCGDGVDNIDCYTSGPQGPCKTEIEAAARTDSIETLQIRYQDFEYALAPAIYLSRCINAECEPACLSTTCGNGKIDPTDPPEECDDGNTQSGDGCSATCLVEECGNGRLDANEACDYGEDADAYADICNECEYNMDCRDCQEAKCTDVAGDNLLTACLDGDDSCVETMSCIWETGCADESIIDCYCGRYVLESECTDADIGPAGPCVMEIESAADTTEAESIMDTLASADDSFLGDAVRLTECDRDACPMCFGYTDGDVDTDGDTDTDTDVDTDTDTDADTDTDTDADTDIDTDACPSCEEEHCTRYQIGTVAGTFEPILMDLLEACYEGEFSDTCPPLDQCVKSSNCEWKQCYCGTASDTTCMVGLADGPCKTEVEEAAETSDPMEIGERFSNFEEYALGVAMNLFLCNRESCPDC